MLQVSTGLASRRREAPPQYSAWIYTLGRIRKKDAFAPSRRAFGAVPRRMRPPAKPKLPQSMPARPPPSVRDWAGRERPWSLDRRLAAPTPFSSVKSAALARKRWPISGKRQCLAKINIGLTWDSAPGPRAGRADSFAGIIMPPTQHIAWIWALPTRATRETGSVGEGEESRISAPFPRPLAPAPPEIPQRSRGARSRGPAAGKPPYPREAGRPQKAE